MIFQFNFRWLRKQSINGGYKDSGTQIAQDAYPKLSYTTSKSHIDISALLEHSDQNLYHSVNFQTDPYH